MMSEIYSDYCIWAYLNEINICSRFLCHMLKRECFVLTWFLYVPQFSPYALLEEMKGLIYKT